MFPSNPTAISAVCADLPPRTHNCLASLTLTLCKWNPQGDSPHKKTVMRVMASYWCQLGVDEDGDHMIIRTIRNLNAVTLVGQINISFVITGSANESLVQSLKYLHVNLRLNLNKIQIHTSS